MSVLVKQTEQKITDLVNTAIKTAVDKGELKQAEYLPFNVEIPADTSHGDFSVNAAMKNAKTFGKSPRDIAQIIIDNMPVDDLIGKVECAGPGFLNFFVSDRFFSEIILDVLDKKEDYGKSDYGKGKRVLVEFVSANPTGPMHIGNARGGALGDGIAAVYEAAGYYVEREFYVNDAGNQIEKFKTSLEKRYLQLFDSSIEMPEDCYLGEDIVIHAKNFKEKYGDKYLNCDAEERRTALCDFALPQNIAGLERDLAKYRINYNTWYKESSLHNSGKVQKVIEKLIASGHTYEEGGALWLRSTDYGDEKDRVLVRENGVPTYLVPDIAYHYDKLVTRNFDIAIDVLGADHHGYVPRLKASLEALGVDSDRLKVVIMQMVRLVKNGETYKLSKRSGKAVTLATLLDEVPLDAARFIFNSKEPNTHLEFDLDLAVEESSQNPVYYVQYAHARICSILRNLAAEGIQQKTADVNNLSLLKAPEEKELIRHISGLTDTVVEAAKAQDPSKITKFAFDTATLFHKFYNACRVKCDDDALMQARLSLCIAVKTVLLNCLSVLKIDAPESI
ncbi:MAG: arginine--tRNA ligase [Oscillospiraceae bacterium]|nr:arginine--tRNA ligase [Candidatus Equicaccousia limihippi]